MATKRKVVSTKSSGSVFEAYAHEYDLLTDASAREASHDREVAALVEGFHPRSVLDAGCATGLTAMLFARRGIDTVGLDRSMKMLREAERKHGQQGYPLRFRHGQFERLPRHMDGSFDLVVCLANSISGVATGSGLNAAAKSFFRVLAPGGALVLQSLNHFAIRENTLSPVKATVSGGIIYERFFERRGRRQCLYVTRLDTNSRPYGLEVFRHQSQSFTPTEIVSALESAGFVKIARFSDLFMATRFSGRSHDLVLVGRKFGRRPPLSDLY